MPIIRVPEPISPAEAPGPVQGLPVPAPTVAPDKPPAPPPITTEFVQEHPVLPLTPPPVAAVGGPEPVDTRQVGPPHVASSATSPDSERAGTDPSFDIVRVSPQGSAVVAGRASPNADVTLLDNGHEIGRTQADESGQWVVLPDQKLPPGGQQLTIAAKEPGKPEVAGREPVVVVLPARGPAGQATESETLPAPLVVLTPLDSAARVLQAPTVLPGPPAKAGSGKVGLDVVDYDDHGAIRFAGTGAPGSLVRLYVDDLAVGDAIVDPQGRWGLVPTAAVATGDHRLRVDDLGIRGQVTARVELPFQRALLSPDEVLAGHVVVQPRQNLWRLARRAYGQGVRYTVIYEANRDQIRNPDLIYPGQIFAIPPFLDAAAPTASSETSASASKSK